MPGGGDAVRGGVQEKDNRSATFILGEVDGSNSVQGVRGGYVAWVAGVTHAYVAWEGSIGGIELGSHGPCGGTEETQDV